MQCTGLIAKLSLMMLSSEKHTPRDKRPKMRPWHRHDAVVSWIFSVKNNNQVWAATFCSLFFGSPVLSLAVLCLQSKPIDSQRITGFSQNFWPPTPMFCHLFGCEGTSQKSECPNCRYLGNSISVVSPKVGKGHEETIARYGHLGISFSSQ